MYYIIDNIYNSDAVSTPVLAEYECAKFLPLPQLSPYIFRNLYSTFLNYSSMRMYVLLSIFITFFE